jgi:hypothetical protein
MPPDGERLAVTNPVAGRVPATQNRGTRPVLYVHLAWLGGENIAMLLGVNEALLEPYHLVKSARLGLKVGVRRTGV